MMLEQEIEKYLSGQTLCNCDSVSYRNIKNLILGFAEPREKQIQIDAEQIRALQKQNGELTDKVKELEAQIEKMRCCGNCANLCGCGLRGYEECKNFDKWEIKEK